MNLLDELSLAVWLNPTFCARQHVRLWAQGGGELEVRGTDSADATAPLLCAGDSDATGYGEKLSSFAGWGSCRDSTERFDAGIVAHSESG